MPLLLLVLWLLELLPPLFQQPGQKWSIKNNKPSLQASASAVIKTKKVTPTYIASFLFLLFCAIKTTSPFRNVTSCKTPTTYFTSCLFTRTCPWRSSLVAGRQHLRFSGEAVHRWTSKGMERTSARWGSSGVASKCSCGLGPNEWVSENAIYIYTYYIVACPLKRRIVGLPNAVWMLASGILFHDLESPRHC